MVALVDDEESSLDPFARLAVALEADLAGRADVRDAQLAALATAMGDELPDFAAMLASTTPPGEDALRDLEMAPEWKRAALALVGRRVPERRAACFALARTLDHDLGFPHLLVARALSTDSVEGT